MPITKEQLEKEIALLRKMMDETRANLNAISGALQFAERLLAAESEQPTPEAK